MHLGNEIISIHLSTSKDDSSAQRQSYVGLILIPSHASQA